MNSVVSITELVRQTYRRSYSSIGGLHPGYGRSHCSSVRDSLELNSMEPRSLQIISSWCGAEPMGRLPEMVIQRICTDSRQVGKGDLFVALPGDRFDGHDFLNEAVQKGASALMIERNRVRPDLGVCPVVLVESTRKALGQVAAGYRREFSVPIVAVGGSNGKTTTKEILASVLKQKLRVVASEASFNNDIGVPQTLLQLQRHHQAAVIEIGTNHPGEVHNLATIAAPRYGIITSIGREHLEFFGDIKGVAREEGWLAEMLPADGKLFLNGDSEWAGAIANRTRAGVIRAGFDEGNDWRALDLRLDKNGIAFKVAAPKAGYSGDYRINLFGRHQVVNALLAMAAAAELGLGKAEIERGLVESKPAKMRMQLWEFNGVCVLDDAYNANADSMTAALRTLQELPCKGRRVAVLGDMAEQGAHTEALHLEVGRVAAELGVGQLFAVGRMASVVARGAREAGLNRILEFADVDSAAAAVKQFVKAGDLVLLKASRVSRLERVGEWLRMGGAAS